MKAGTHRKKYIPPEQRIGKKEQQRKDYSKAVEADHEQIRQGNYNFKGIGY